MNIIYDVINNETPEEFVLFMTGIKDISHPDLDRHFGMNGWPFLGKNTELIVLIRKMTSAGLIAYSDKGGYTKGPNWYEPAFVTQGKYTFDPK